jgi:hypothetical protein
MNIDFYVSIYALPSFEAAAETTIFSISRGSEQTERLLFGFNPGLWHAAYAR